MTGVGRAGPYGLEDRFGAPDGPLGAMRQALRLTGREAARSGARRWGTSGVVSKRTRAPTALATGAPQNIRPDDSGLMMPGSPRDRNVRTQDRFEPGVREHAHVDQRSNPAWFEPLSA